MIDDESDDENPVLRDDVPKVAAALNAPDPDIVKPSVNDVLSGVDPAKANTLDQILNASPELQEYHGQVQSQLSALDQQIAALHYGEAGVPAQAAGAAPLGSAENPYGGNLVDPSDLPKGVHQYQSPDGSFHLDSNQSRPQVRDDRGRVTDPGNIDARAPLSDVEVRSRNQNDQFFASVDAARNGAPITTRSDTRWRDIFPTAPGALPKAEFNVVAPTRSEVSPIAGFASKSNFSLGTPPVTGPASLTKPRTEALAPAFDKPIGFGLSPFKNGREIKKSAYPTRPRRR